MDTSLIREFHTLMQVEQSSGRNGVAEGIAWALATIAIPDLLTEVNRLENGITDAAVHLDHSGLHEQSDAWLAFAQGGPAPYPGK
jgi:hypothetical protein